MKEETFLLKGSRTGTFTERLDVMCAQLRHRLEEEYSGINGLVWCRVYLSDAANQLDVLRAHPLYTQLLSKGAFSYVEQPPLDGSKISIMVVATKDKIEKTGTPDHRVITCNGVRHLFQSVRFTANETKETTPYDQTTQAFDRHIAWLKAEKMSLKDNCVRTWLFVRNIDHNYKDVVVARNDIFSREGLTSETHYIASTGIGGNSAEADAAVSVDFWSVDDPNMSVRYLQALDYLNPTREYGVAFERGTSFVSDGRRRLLISGTASIDKSGQCIFIGDIGKQIERLFVNIEHLLADGDASLNDVKWMTVYLRDICDAEVVGQYILKRFPDIPAPILYAPVCRPHWLVEVECIAEK